MRNPKWQRDEVILALELYFRTKPGQIHARNPEIIELSEVLNKLPIHEERPDVIKFRNPNGVGLKLSNFLAIDPTYTGKGMESYSKLDESVFKEFANDKTELKRIANEIKMTSDNSTIGNKLYKIANDEDEDAIVVKEGKVIYKLHKHFERNNSINSKKKKQHLAKYKKLECEVCGFDFYNFYGEIGENFIECHHRIPLSEIQVESETKLKDLALVCANCHRMLHRGTNSLTINELKSKIKVANKTYMPCEF